MKIHRAVHRGTYPTKLIVEILELRTNNSDRPFVHPLLRQQDNRKHERLVNEAKEVSSLRESSSCRGPTSIALQSVIDASKTNRINYNFSTSLDLANRMIFAAGESLLKPEFRGRFVAGEIG